jgi:hypothetical protein
MQNDIQNSWLGQNWRDSGCWLQRIVRSLWPDNFTLVVIVVCNELEGATRKPINLKVGVIHATHPNVVNPVL